MSSFSFNEFEVKFSVSEVTSLIKAEVEKANPGFSVASVEYIVQEINHWSGGSGAQVVEVKTKLRKKGAL